MRNKHIYDEKHPRQMLRQEDLLDSEILVNPKSEAKPTFNKNRGKLQIVDAKTSEEIRNYQIFKELEA